MNDIKHLLKAKELISVKSRVLDSEELAQLILSINSDFTIDVNLPTIKVATFDDFKEMVELMKDRNQDVATLDSMTHIKQQQRMPHIPFHRGHAIAYCGFGGTGLDMTPLKNTAEDFIIMESERDVLKHIRGYIHNIRHPHISTDEMVFPSSMCGMDDYARATSCKSIDSNKIEHILIADTHHGMTLGDMGEGSLRSEMVKILMSSGYLVGQAGVEKPLVELLERKEPYKPYNEHYMSEYDMGSDYELKKRIKYAENKGNYMLANDLKGQLSGSNFWDRSTSHTKKRKPYKKRPKKKYGKNKK